MIEAYKFVVKNNGLMSVRNLCADCVKEEIRITVDAGIYSEESRTTIAELRAMPFPSCDVCEASFVALLQEVR